MAWMNEVRVLLVRVETDLARRSSGKSSERRYWRGYADTLRQLLLDGPESLGSKIVDAQLRGLDQADSTLPEWSGSRYYRRGALDALLEADLLLQPYLGKKAA